MNCEKEDIFEFYSRHYKETGNCLRCNNTGLESVFRLSPNHPKAKLINCPNCNKEERN